MVQALKILGYHNIHHMTACIPEPLQNELWHEAVNAKWFGKGAPFSREDWDMLPGDCMVRSPPPTRNTEDKLLTADRP